MSPNSIRIIGVGNPLMGDDGIGIAVAERLAALSLPAGVEVIDGGTGGLTLIDLMAGAERVILLDAVEMGLPPGSIARFEAGDIEPAAENAALSLHETGLAAVFALGRELGTLPERITVFGVEPESVERRLGLSPLVAAALAPLADQVLAEIQDSAIYPGRDSI